MTFLKVFLAQGLYVLLLCAQTLNVAREHLILTSVTSFLLGALGFWVTAVIAEVRKPFTVEWWGFVLAGVVSAPATILLYRAFA